MATVHDNPYWQQVISERKRKESNRMKNEILEFLHYEYEKYSFWERIIYFIRIMVILRDKSYLYVLRDVINVEFAECKQFVHNVSDFCVHKRFGLKEE